MKRTLLSFLLVFAGPVGVGWAQLDLSTGSPETVQIAPTGEVDVAALPDVSAETLDESSQPPPVFIEILPSPPSSE